MNLALFIATAASATTLSAPQTVDRQACVERITQVREATGQPPLGREAAPPEQSLVIAAVDKRVAGCRVLVMAADPRDIRPEPEIRKGPRLFIPAR